MKKILFLLGAFAFLTFASCDNKEEVEESVEPGQETGSGTETEYDDAYYAEHATISCSDGEFTATGDGGTVMFDVQGGSVVIDVDCGTGWIAENTASDHFKTSTTSSSITITAGQNTSEDELSGTVTLMTANDKIDFATIDIIQLSSDGPEIDIAVSEWRVPAKGELTTEIAVEANAPWSATTDVAWLMLETTDTVLKITADENVETEERTARINVTCTDGIWTVSRHVDVTQDAAAYITVSLSSLFFDSDASSTAIEIASNYDWGDFICSEDWFSISLSGSTLTVSVEENTATEDRTGTLTLTAGDGLENIATVEISVTQSRVLSDEEAAMVFVYSITSANTSTTIPLSGEVNCTVDWGDGTVESVSSEKPSHTYASTGEYEIAISGTVTALYNYAILSSQARLPITSVKQWGKTGLTNMSYAFYACNQLVSLPDDAGTSFTSVTSFSHAFQGCSVLVDIPEKLFGDYTTATDFSYCFYECSVLGAIPSGLFANCNEATNFSYAFNSCKALTEVPSGLFSKNTKAESFSRTFSGCSGLKTIQANMFEGCGSATDFSYTFYNCTALTAIPSGLFDTCTSAKDFSEIFRYDSKITSLPTGLFKNTAGETFARAFCDCAFPVITEGLLAGCSKATDMSYLFANNNSIEEIPESLLEDCTSLVNLEGMFSECSYLVYIPSGLFTNCSSAEIFTDIFYNDYSVDDGIPEGLFSNCVNATSFGGAFHGWTYLRSIPDDLFANCSKVTDFAQVFYECSNLQSIPETLFANCPEVTDFTHAFNRCTSLTEIPAGLFSGNRKVTTFEFTFCKCSSVTSESPYDMVDGVKVHLYERENYASGANGYTRVSVYSGCFEDCTNMADYADMPAGWTSH